MSDLSSVSEGLIWMDDRMERTGKKTDGDRQTTRMDGWMERQATVRSYHRDVLSTETLKTQLSVHPANRGSSARHRSGPVEESRPSIDAPGPPGKYCPGSHQPTPFNAEDQKLYPKNRPHQ